MIAHFASPASVALLQQRFAAWEGTPFRAHACVPGAGVDCLRMAIAIMQECGVPLQVALPDYGLSDGAARGEEGPVMKNLRDNPLFRLVWERAGAACEPVFLPGDLLCFNIGRSVHHLGIVADARRFFHSIRDHGAIYSMLEDTTYRTRLAAVFTPLLAPTPA